MATVASLSEVAIAEFLDAALQVEFTYRNTAEAAHLLAELPRADQDFVLDWVQRAASTNIEVAYQFACLAGRALRAMDRKLMEAWVLHAMDTYDKAGLRPAVMAIQGVDDFLRLDRERTAGAVLAEKSGVLLHFLNGLSGRQLKLEEGEGCYTDTDTVFLPSVLAELPSEEENFSLYKASAVMLWAQTRYGTFRPQLFAAMEVSPRPDRLLSLFLALEGERLEMRIARELPGLYRQMQVLRGPVAEGPPGWAVLVKRARAEGMRMEDALALAAQHCDTLQPPVVPAYFGELNLAAVRTAREKRIEREKARFRVAMRELIEEQRSKQPDAPGKLEQRPKAEQEKGEGALDVEILLDDRPIAPPENVRQLTSSILLDFGELPEDYLSPAGPGDYDPRLLEDVKPDLENVWQGTYHEEGAVFYNEWDYQRRHYRKNWCVMRETELKPVYDDFVADALRRYSGMAAQLRKTFEAMRDEDRLLRRQNDGDDVDLDALVEALADAREGREVSPALYTRVHRAERNIAVAFMVDMSGSTRGWINDAEREALILLCEALESLGDRYAIYGFSGTTRKRCDLFRIKAFEEPYGPLVQGRISAIRPQDYTRMGFAIRHLTTLLAETDARTRVLITLSDGKPDDLTDYRGEYGIEDTRRALIEARRAGIHPYCITIDETARDYLPHMYGPAAFSVVDDVRTLPFKVSDIYRRLTT